MREKLLKIDALTRTGDVAAALELCLQELAVAPAFEFWVTAAGLALRLERFDDACEWLQQAHALRPDFVPVRRQLSQVLNRVALTAADESAVTNLQQALALWPDNHPARFNLAQRLLASAPQRALQLASELLQHNPTDIDAAELQALAAAACGSEPPLTAVTSVLLGADRALIVRRCAEQLAWNSSPAAATALFEQVHAARPADALAAIAQHLALPACYASSAELQQARQHYCLGLAALPQLLSPTRLQQQGSRLEDLSWSNFLLAYQGGNDRLLQAQYGDWLVAAATKLHAHSDPRQRPRRPGPRRIGLLSSFWRRCTVGAYFGAWVGALRCADSEVTLISLGHAPDDVTAQLEAQADRSLRLNGTLAQQAQAVAALDLDLLIYPELGMHGMTQVLAALRLARQQWCGWGHPVSCGLSSIDRQISVAGMEPDDAAAHYCEPLVLLPGLGTRYVLPQSPQPCARAEVGLPEGLLIALPSSAFKLHPDGDAELGQLLAARPHARAVLLETEPPGAMGRLRARLDKALREVGADPQRQLHWHSALPREDFLRLLGCCDVLLDPWHWSGGNTALDALLMGLPILARWGEFMRGRQSAAMLEQLGVSGVAGQQDLLDHAEARVQWRDQVAERLPTLVDGQSALQALRAAVQSAVEI